MSVAKPTIEGSPPPLTSHSDDGLPGLEFSQTIGLPPGSHGSAACALTGTSRKDSTTTVTVRTTVRAREARGRRALVGTGASDHHADRLLEDHQVEGER